jgi:hypothetical protein
MSVPDAATMPNPEPAPEQRAPAPAIAKPAAAGHATAGEAESGASTAESVQRAPGAWRRYLEAALRVGGCLVAVLAALLSGVLEVVFASWRVGGHLIGASAVAAVLMNVGIAWFAYRTVGRRWAVGLPWVVWTVLMFVAAGVRTAEGDYLLAGDNWVALVMILLGSLAFAIYAYRMILNGAPRR